MQNNFIELVPADVSLAEQVLDYYRRNRGFLEKFEPRRDDEFFSLEHQREILRTEMCECKENTAFRFMVIPFTQPNIWHSKIRKQLDVVPSLPCLIRHI